VSVAIITGSSGLVGSEAVRFFHDKGFDVVGIDNDMRKSFFGPGASTEHVKIALERDLKHYEHQNIDIRDSDRIDELFRRYRENISVIVHAAAQPSHDWAKRDPLTDFSINAGATLNLLENTRRNCPNAVFIFISTNKVYGDRINQDQFDELECRYELPLDHPLYNGVTEEFNIDRTTHSLFGVSKLSGDLMVQEYGRYFKLKTGVFRCGCLTGPHHAMPPCCKS